MGVKVALTADGNLYSRFFIETGITTTPNPFDPWPYDNFESSASGSYVDGLTGGWAWAGAYSTTTLISDFMYDTLDGYAVTDTVSGSNGGVGWSGPITSN